MVAQTVIAGADIRFQRANPVQACTQLEWQNAKRAPAPNAVRWQQAAPRHVGIQLDWQDAEQLPLWIAMRYQRARAQHGAPVRGRFQQATQLHRASTGRYQDALPMQGEVAALRYQYAIRTHRWLASRYQVAKPLSFVVDERGGYGASVARMRSSRYQDAIHFSPGIYHGPGPGPGPGTDPEPSDTVVVPVKRTYMTINTLELRRIDTDQELLAYGFTLAIDASNWTWSWSATLRGDALAVVQRPPGQGPVVVEAVLNGVAYRFLVEQISRQQQFPSTRISVSGRGLAAILASPFAPSLSHGSSSAMTAQQLMTNVLTLNGVGIGWELDWQLEDWLVPAGAWAMQGTYIDAVKDIAEAVGGYVQPHPTAQRLRILPRYPSAPWTWGDVTPDIELPAAPVQVVTTEWVDRPAYNRVYVGGTSDGVFGPVTRTGTAGDLLAEQVNHALITDATAHRQRGLAELASGGRQVHMRLNLQVLPETGLILPGKFVRWLGGTSPAIGMVRSLAYDWSSKRQTIEIETHA